MDCAERIGDFWVASVTQKVQRDVIEMARSTG
jgi:hypothetical protein